MLEGEEMHLQSVIVHRGSLETGHFFTYQRTSENQWLELNDHKATPFNPAYLDFFCFSGQTKKKAPEELWKSPRKPSQSAYVLFY